MTQIDTQNNDEWICKRTLLFKEDIIPCNHRMKDKNEMQTWKFHRLNRSICATMLSLILMLSFLVYFSYGDANEIIEKRQRIKRHIPEDCEEKENVCMTEDCVKAAARILSAMDKRVDPCEDFYEHACRRWNQEHVIPDDRSSFEIFSNLRDSLQITLKGLLEETPNKKEPQSIVLARNLFQSCVNKTMIESRGHDPILALLKTFEGWPVISKNWDEKSFDLEVLMGKLRLLNNRVLINHWVSSDERNSSNNIIQMDQSQLGLYSRSFYLEDKNEKQLKAYEIFAKDVALLLGAEEEIAEKEMSEMIAFEIKIANLTMPNEERRDHLKLYNKLTVADLYTLTDAIDWLKYFKIVFLNVSIEIGKDEPLVLHATEYIRELGVLLKSTPKRTLANYMVWRIVMNRVQNLPEDFIDLRNKFNKVIFGVEKQSPLWRICASTVNDNLGMALGRLFVEKKFDEDAKEFALEMIYNIRDAFKDLLNEVEWMDHDTRLVAREKVDAIQERIGYPDYILNDTALDDEYYGINMEPDKYFENIVTHLNYITARNLKKLRKPVQKQQWSTPPAIVNAFYNGAKNQIIFPAAIFQPPFYHKNYPKFMNYANIGMVMGHEITHGFDDTGRQFDKDGNLRQWWPDSVVNNFKERAECIVEQYGNYTIPEVGLKLNGKNTQGENIADNGGLKQTYRAYKKWLSNLKSPEPSLPGLTEYSNEQLFFLSFAQMWCGIARKESFAQVIASGRHSPGRFRVIGPLSNFDEFSKAYNCPVGSNMNPERKCQVW